MFDSEPTMTPSQMAALVDAALGAQHPLSFFDSAVATFNVIGRHRDGTAAAWIGCLYAENEIELLLSLRSAWRRGEDRCPRKAADEALRRAL